MTNLRTRRSLACLIAAVASTIAGCEKPPVPIPPDPFGNRCDEASFTQQPDLMGMSMDFRANVSTTHQRGVVAVRYAATSCDDVVLEVLPNCVGKGTYEFSAYPGNETRLASSKLELFAKLPLGAASLEGKLKAGHSLRTDYMFAGMLTLEIGKPYERGRLDGTDCERATHIVNRIYVGGFALASGQTREIEAAATVFGLGFGAGHGSAGEVIASEGLRDKCAEAQQAGELSPLCQAPLRLGLLALSDTPKADDEAFVKVLVVDANKCRANVEVWNGTRCESLTAPPRTRLDDLYFRDEHGCKMGIEVWFAKESRCVPGDGDDIYKSLQLEPTKTAPGSG